MKTAPASAWSACAALVACAAVFPAFAKPAADDAQGDNPTHGFLYNAMEEYGGSAQPVFPLGTMDAWGYVISGKSVRAGKVRSGGALDDAGVRERDEMVGAQVGGKFVAFNKDPREYLRVLGEAVDAAMAPGGVLKLKMLLDRQEGFTTVALPHSGRFVPGYAIDKMTSQGKENKNEIFFRGCSDWLVSKDKAGQLNAGAALNPGLAWAGLALMASPNPAHEAVVGKWVEAIEADWAKPGRKPTASPGGDQDSYGHLLFSEAWSVLLLSEYNWRHPDYKRRAVLQKACDDMAECLLNPSYLYMEPSYRKHDQGTTDATNPGKEYYKGRFAYVDKSAPKFPTFHGPAEPVGWRPDPRSLAMAWWCWSHCAKTSGIEVNPQALQVARRYLLDIAMPGGGRAFPKNKDGSFAFAIDRETAACFAQALLPSANKDEAAIGAAMAAFVNKSPMALIGDQSEFGMAATSSLWTRTGGAAACKEHFNEWRWYLALMMQSQGDAHFCKLVVGPPYWQQNPLGDKSPKGKSVVANGIAAFLLAAPSRQLLMLGASHPVEHKVYELGKGPSQ